MKREDKNEIIDSLVEQLRNTKHFYLTDISGLNASTTSALRRKCFENKIELLVVKNTLLKKALEKLDRKYEELYGVLTNSTSIMFTETANVPARMIKEFRKGCDHPILKGAFIEESIFIGDNQLDSLTDRKSVV